MHVSPPFPTPPSHLRWHHTLALLSEHRPPDGPPCHGGTAERAAERVLTPTHPASFSCTHLSPATRRLGAPRLHMAIVTPVQRYWQLEVAPGRQNLKMWQALCSHIAAQQRRQLAVPPARAPRRQLRRRQAVSVARAGRAAPARQENISTHLINRSALASGAGGRACSRAPAALAFSTGSWCSNREQAEAPT